MSLGLHLSSRYEGGNTRVLRKHPAACGAEQAPTGAEPHAIVVAEGADQTDFATLSDVVTTDSTVEASFRSKGTTSGQPLRPPEPKSSENEAAAEHAKGSHISALSTRVERRLGDSAAQAKEA